MDEKKVVNMEPVIDLIWTTEDEPLIEANWHEEPGVGDTCGAGCTFGHRTSLARNCR